jgi:hypothetical protein
MLLQQKNYKCNTMNWIDINERKPTKPGKYIIRTVTSRKNVNRFEARFDGKNFDINNQITTHWLEE